MPDPQVSAEWLIGRIVAWQEAVGRPIPPEWIALYRTPVPMMREEDRLDALRAHHLGVDAVREAITYEKRHGAPTMKVRPGLRVPLEWEHHYEVVYGSGFPWFISGVVQSAFLGNPLVGERRPWKSP